MPAAKLYKPTRPEEPQATLEQPQAPATQDVPQICATCAGWSQSHMRRSIGQCMPSSGLHPLMTTDRQSCSDWKLRGA